MVAAQSRYGQLPNEVVLGVCKAAEQKEQSLLYYRPTLALTFRIELAVCSPKQITSS